jgi:hypothetical protein
MRVPIRIIGIVTSIFWIFLIIFSASAIYSLKDIQFSLGQPQVSTTEDNQLLFSFPVSITNTGFYNLGHFNMSTKILNVDGSEVARGSTFVPIIVQGQTINITHDMRLNIIDLLHTSPDLLSNDTELRVNETVSMSAAEVVPIQASSYLPIPWGAPLHNLALGMPEFVAYNSTHLRVNIPFSFENHAFFDLTGSVKARIYNNANVLIGQGQTNMEVSQRSPYHGDLELYILSRTIPRTHVEVLFTTQFFKYGPLVIDYGS